MRVPENSLGFRVRAARCNVNLNQKQFAQMLGIGPNYLGAIERGVKNPSDDLLLKIAKSTGTTYSWLIGKETDSAPIPEVDPNLSQIRDSSATTGYLVSILDAALTEKGFRFERPQSLSDYPKTDWLPNYWVTVLDSPLKYWAFDFSFVIYNQPDFFNRSGKPNLKANLANFVFNVMWSKVSMRDRIKYTFLVPDAESFHAATNRLPVSVGNASVIQIDLEKREVVREQYISMVPSVEVQEALENLKF